MIEQVVQPRETHAAPGGIGSIFDDDGDAPGMATVASGVHSERLPVANASVGEIRARFRDRFDIDPRSQAMLNGQPVGDDVVVRPGQLLMFTNRAGEKGRGRSVS